MSLSGESAAKYYVCHVVLNSITLRASTWTLHSFNLIITNAIIPETKFILTSNNQDGYQYSVEILASRFGQIKTLGSFQINISNCVINGTKRPTSTLIDILNSSVNINHFIFFNQIKYDAGPAIINGVNSHINLANVNIFQNYAVDGLIWASTNSKMHINNSTFDSNGMFLWTSGVLILKQNSVLFLSKCTCQNNGAIYGPCIHASDNVSIIAKTSIFYYNHAIRGGAIYLNNNYQTDGIYIKETIIDNKNNKTGINVNNPGQNNLNRGHKGTLIFMECKFYLHTASKGGVFYIEGSSLDIFMNQCLFRSNRGCKVGGSIFLQGGYPLAIRLYLEGCNFRDGTSMKASTIFVRQAQVDIHNCTIYNCFYSIMSVANNSILNISYMFIENSVAIFGYIDIQDSVVLSMVDSNMTSHFAATYPNGFFIYARNNCSVVVSNSVFGDGSHNWVMRNIFGHSLFLPRSNKLHI